MEIICGLLGGTLVAAILTFVQFLINRNDKKESEKNEILKAIGSLKQSLEDFKEKREQDKAEEARERILMFDDEIRRGLGHSSESFDQILKNINLYTSYCKSHENYENNKAVSAIENINTVYNKVKAENSFI